MTPEEAKAAMQVEHPATRLFSMLVHEQIYTIMSEAPQSVEEGLVLGHQLGSVLLAAAIGTVITTAKCAGAVSLPPEMREMMLNATAKCYDDLAAEFAAGVVDGSATGEVA